jgi:hypothetical protein
MATTSAIKQMSGTELIDRAISARFLGLSLNAARMLKGNETAVPQRTVFSMNDLRGLPHGGLITNHEMSASRGMTASQILIVPRRVRG